MTKIASALSRHVPTLFSAARTIIRGDFELLPPRRTFALGELHEKIKKRFPQRGGSYFEVGANDGLTQSNTAYLDFYQDWNGILVEAVPHKFVECVQNRPRAVAAHAALVDFAYDQPSVEIRYSNLMSLTAQSLKDLNSHLSEGQPFVRETGLAGQSFLAPARTVMSIVDEAGFPPVDLFSLDVEGAELSVLGGIDFQRWRPGHFLVETSDMPAMSAFMSERGYDQSERLTFHDYLFKSRS